VFWYFSVLVKTLSVFKSVFIFPINLRIAQKYFGEAAYLRTIFQIRGFLCLPGTQIAQFVNGPLEKIFLGWRLLRNYLALRSIIAN
jgi:hypothetical protein